MDEKHEIIKAKVKNAYARIKDAEKILEECREQCEHPETELCIYSSRPGQYWADTEVCSICGEVVKWAFTDAVIKEVEDSRNDSSKSYRDNY